MASGPAETTQAATVPDATLSPDNINSSTIHMSCFREATIIFGVRT